MQTRPLILGTAGHIDHGKTTLIKALTGIDADRLPEEKERGMTIDLGFAHTEIDGRRIGIVDVPGHEKFLRNMVAGATGIDLVMLVVAADDAVMPQTREHLEIIDLLGVAGGLVALNKVDVASEEKCAAAEAAIRKLTQGTCLEDAPIVRVSGATGQGLDALRAAIASRLRDLDFKPWPPLFRVPIDRKFSLQGHGTIVTGSLLGGDIKATDEVELMPRGKKVRVRSAQSHGAERSGLDSGRRVALNLPGVKVKELERGMELAAPGYLRASTRFAVQLRCLDNSPLEIASSKPFRLHIGTQDVDARFALLGHAELDPGEECFAILQTGKELCATHDQRFIVRSPSHGVTIGGGSVISTDAPKVKLSGPCPEWLRVLADGEPADRILAALQLEPQLGANLRALYRETGVEPDACEALLSQLADEKKIRKAGGKKGGGYWTEAYIASSKQTILERVEKLLEEARPRANISEGPLLKATKALGPPEFAAWLLKELEAEGELRLGNGRIERVGYQVALSPAELEDQERMLTLYHESGLTPPGAAAVAERAGVAAAKAEPLLQNAIDTGALVGVNQEMVLHRAVHEDLLNILRTELGSGEGITVSSLKDRLKISRKYAIPLCEHLDRKGYTRRDGDLRYAGPKLLEAAPARS